MKSRTAPALPAGRAPRPGPEDGQALVFGVITLLFVFVLIFSVFRTGTIAHRRLQVQSAADIAAYAGANVEANNVSMMAFVNRGMAFIYYNLMRYAVDCAVFGTMKTYKDHDGFVLSFINWGYFGARTCPDNYIDTDGYLNLTGKDIGDLYDDAKSNYDDDVEKGVEWIQDLYSINRGIADATPVLVRREVYLVGRENGAQNVCLFPDVFETPASGGLSRNFSPHQAESGNTSYVKHEEDLDRWAYQIAVDQYGGEYMGLSDLGGFSIPPEKEPTTPLLPVEEKIPDWFDAVKGKPRGEDKYFQIRECWNDRDIDHDQSHLSMLPWPWVEEPPGHFHHWHIHIKMYGSVPVITAIHKNGHSGDDHTDNWDFYIPKIPMLYDLDGYRHHAIIDCPTCTQIYWEFLKWDADGDLSTDVYKELGDSDVGSRANVPIEQGWPHGQPDKFAPPLVLDEGVFKYGINVGTWREARNTGGFLEDAPWGFLAVASAKIGFLRDGKIMVFRSDTRQAGDEDTDYEAWLASAKNLYEIEWGAKLVPIRDSLYDKETDVLFRGLVGGVWMTSPSDRVGNVAANAALANLPLEFRFGAGPGGGFGTKQTVRSWDWSDNSDLEDALRH